MSYRLGEINACSSDVFLFTAVMVVSLKGLYEYTETIFCLEACVTASSACRVVFVGGEAGELPPHWI